MPIFPYKCSKCECTFEVIRKASDDGNEFCPECQEPLTKEDRMVGSTSFKLEGNGWYKDGYANKGAEKYNWQE